MYRVAGLAGQPKDSTALLDDTSPEPTREALEGSDRRQVLRSHRPPEEDVEQACPGLLEHQSFRDPWGLGSSDELASQAPCSNRLSLAAPGGTLLFPGLWEVAGRRLQVEGSW